MDRLHHISGTLCFNLICFTVYRLHSSIVCMRNGRKERILNTYVVSDIICIIKRK